MSSTRVTQRINAPRPAVYRALVDEHAVAAWMVPDGMTSEVHEFDAREDGTFRISLTYDEATGTGKTTAHTDTYHGRFVELVPDERVVQVVEFEATDPRMRGEMTITMSLSDLAGGGTEIVAVHDGLPPALSAADNETGWRISLGKLATLVEPVARRTATHVVLVHPEIHWNTGNTGRTCLATGATLHLIEPLGFSLDEREVKRAGLDYWEYVDLRVWPTWEAFERELPALGEPFFFSTRAARLIWDAPLGTPNGVVLIFGRETGGLPAELHERYSDRFVTMPVMSTRVRSLNLSTSVAVAVYEVLRQRRAAARDGRASHSG